MQTAVALSLVCEILTEIVKVNPLSLKFQNKISGAEPLSL